MSCQQEPETSEYPSKETSPGSQKRTTPPQTTKVRNPFERALLHRLHKPICSPGMCKTYKKSRDGSFRWEIEQHCTLMPADIVACSSQFEPSPDPQFDRIHEEATERFFSQEVIVPSPFLQVSKKEKFSVTSSGNFARNSTKIVRDASSQTVLSLPAVLPPEIESILDNYCTYTQEEKWSEGCDWEMRWSSEHQSLSDSEVTDDDRGSPLPVQHYDTHAPVHFSPHLLKNAVSKGMKRTFGTPLGKVFGSGGSFRKTGDGEEPVFSPISAGDHTPSTGPHSISPVHKPSSDDEHKEMGSEGSEGNAGCVCRSRLGRSASLKEGRHRSVSNGRLVRSASLSSSSDTRSRSVQRLDFSWDMSVDSPDLALERFRSHSALAGSDSSGSPKHKDWQTNQHHKSDANMHRADFHMGDNHTIDETPIKSKSKTNAATHGINHIRSGASLPCVRMDVSFEESEDDKNPLDLEDKKIDFNSIDLNLLTEGSKFNRGRKISGGVSLKRLDSGFNENTTMFGQSSYYESAIRPSELTVTDMKSNASRFSKETSNVNWMRVDSGFKDETSSDTIQFYTEGASSQQANFEFPVNNGPNKENVFIEDFDNFLVRASTRDEAMSISDIFADEMVMNCNFSSTPSKNKPMQ